MARCDVIDFDSRPPSNETTDVFYIKPRLLIKTDPRIGHNDKSYANVEEDLQYLECNTAYFGKQYQHFSYHAASAVYPTPHYIRRFSDERVYQ